MNNNCFLWIKKGILISGEQDCFFTHASHPCAVHYKDDTYIIAFTRRDSKQRSHIFLFYANVSNGKIEILTNPVMAMCPGKIGYFDTDGVISADLIRKDQNFYVYFSGWQNMKDGVWACNTGRAILNPEELTLVREFEGPILGRNKDMPLFAVSCAVHEANNRWQTWLASGVSWKYINGVLSHRYGIHHATSTNGVDWEYGKDLCIPFADEYEYAFGRPTVFVKDGIYYMWFAHRATKDIATYRMGFASSTDGITWNRNDAISGIDVSPDGWDSEMICYPYVFEHKGKMYMLYNGNGYGKTGFGLAVLEE